MGGVNRSYMGVVLMEHNPVILVGEFQFFLV